MISTIFFIREEDATKIMRRRDCNDDNSNKNKLVSNHHDYISDNVKDDSKINK